MQKHIIRNYSINNKIGTNILHLWKIIKDKKKHLVIIIKDIAAVVPTLENKAAFVFVVKILVSSSELRERETEKRRSE